MLNIKMMMGNGLKWSKKTTYATGYIKFIRTYVTIKGLKIDPFLIIPTDSKSFMYIQ